MVRTSSIVPFSPTRPPQAPAGAALTTTTGSTSAAVAMIRLMATYDDAAAPPGSRWRHHGGMVTEDDVRRVALSLPATTEKPSYGMPAWRVKDKGFARIREEGDVLVLWLVDLGEKEALLASEPDKFFTTPHYDGYAMVLVRFDAIDVDELTELLTDAWFVRAPKKLADEFESQLRGSEDA